MLPLSDAVEVVHSKGGLNFKENYFGDLHPGYYVGEVGLPPVNDAGTVQTVLFQYMLKLSQLRGGAPVAPAAPTGPELPATDSGLAPASAPSGPDAGLAIFGMLNHVEADFEPCSATDTVYCGDFKQDKVKLGAELSVTPFKELSFGARFDRVMPDGGNEDVAYSAISPRIMLHTRWISREYILLSYTHYLFGSQAVARNPNVPPGSAPRDDTLFAEPDPNLFVLSAMVSF